MHESPNGIGIVAIVGNECGATVTKEIETAWRGLHVADKRSQTGTDDLPIQTKRPTCPRSSHCIIDLECNSAILRDRNPTQRDPVFGIGLRSNNRIAIEIDDTLALRAVFDNYRVFGIAGKKRH